MSINYSGTSMSAKTLESRYNSKAQEREMYLSRARSCSELTIPTLIPPSGNTSSEEFETPYQGIGARGLNNLASKDFSKLAKNLSLDKGVLSETNILLTSTSIVFTIDSELALSPNIGCPFSVNLFLSLENMPASPLSSFIFLSC